MITITFPDGKTKQYESGVTGYQIAQDISPRLAAEVLAMKVDGKLTDIQMPLTQDASVRFLNGKTKTASRCSGILHHT